MAMETAEKVVVILCLFGGFLWLRGRARSLSLERQQGRVLVGIFIVLPALLIAETKGFERLHIGPWTDILLKALIILGTIAAVGFGFLRPAPEEGPRDPDARGPEGRDGRDHPADRN